MERYEYYIVITQTLPINLKFELSEFNKWISVVLTSTSACISFLFMPRYVSPDGRLKFDVGVTRVMVLLWLLLMYAALWHQMKISDNIFNLFKRFKIINSEFGFIKYNSLEPVLKLIVNEIFMITVMYPNSSMTFSENRSENNYLRLAYVHLLTKYYTIVNMFIILIEIWVKLIDNIIDSIDSRTGDPDRFFNLIFETNRLLKTLYDFLSLAIICFSLAGFLSIYNNLFFHYVIFRNRYRDCRELREFIGVLSDYFQTTTWLCMILHVQGDIFFRHYRAGLKVIFFFLFKSHERFNFLL